MHLQHVASHHFQSVTRRYPISRQISPTAIFLILFWIFAIRYGERTNSTNHVKTCDWSAWEKWPAGATPHHLVFIADPQLVDPHTYPGRPWPLSALTESYTDQYMAQNFRLINELLDPDSVVFLGDLLDGGREWSTSKARPLNAHQRKYLEDLGVKAPGSSKRSVDMPLSFGQSRVTSGTSLSKRDRDPKAFVHGENGRWRRWGPAQWDEEYDRFGRIFLAPEQLYPASNRETHAAWEVSTHPISVENGASEIRTEEYAISGGKTRRVITSLPGNHDLGFGPGVQLAVRQRYETHFGEGNRVDVFGNHTFVSIDAPSLAAYSQFEPGGGDSTEAQAEERKSIWQPAMTFMGSVQAPVAKATNDYLDDMFPDVRPDGRTLAHVSGSDSTKSARRTVQDQAQLPVILLSHVPLYRDPNTDCGKLRERGKAISIQGGYQYQNALTRSLSTKIAQQVSIAGEIVHIFSGDDHDYCDVSHRWNLVTGNGKSRLQNIREITVKSFSWAMGVRKPGFLLVSLWNPVNEKGESIGSALPTVQTHLCLLPDQLGVFVSYAQLAGLTLIILLMRAIVVAIRGTSTPDTDEDTADIPSKLALIRSRSPSKQPTSLANGFSTPTKPLMKSRHRAASTSLSSTPAQDASHLSVQRSYNARTRSVSPYTPSPSSGGLIEKAGLYPSVQWADPSDDEESNVGSVGDYGEGFDRDSQGKWKRRPRKQSVARRAWGEFWRGLGIVGGVAGAWYVFMVRTG